MRKSKKCLFFFCIWCPASFWGGVSQESLRKKVRRPLGALKAGLKRHHLFPALDALSLSRPHDTNYPTLIGRSGKLNTSLPHSILLHTFFWESSRRINQSCHGKRIRPAMTGFVYVFMWMIIYHIVVGKHQYINVCSWRWFGHLPLKNYLKKQFSHAAIGSFLDRWTIYAAHPGWSCCQCLVSCFHTAGLDPQYEHTKT